MTPSRVLPLLCQICSFQSNQCAATLENQPHEVQASSAGRSTFNCSRCLQVLWLRGRLNDYLLASSTVPTLCLFVSLEFYGHSIIPHANLDWWPKNFLKMVGSTHASGDRLHLKWPCRSTPSLWPPGTASEAWLQSVRKWSVAFLA